MNTCEQDSQDEHAGKHVWCKIVESVSRYFLFCTSFLEGVGSQKAWGPPKRGAPKKRGPNKRGSPKKRGGPQVGLLKSAGLQQITVKLINCESTEAQ